AAKRGIQHSDLVGRDEQQKPVDAFDAVDAVEQGVEGKLDLVGNGITAVEYSVDVFDQGDGRQIRPHLLPVIDQRVVETRGQLIDVNRKIEVFGDRTDEAGFATTWRAVEERAVLPRQSAVLEPVSIVDPS